MGQAQIDALASKLQEEGIDAFLGWSETSLSYLHGYHEHAGHRFLTLGVNCEGAVALICGALSENQARRAGIADVRPWRDGEDPLKLMHDLAEEWNLRAGVIAVDEDMPALMLLKLQSLLPGRPVQGRRSPPRQACAGIRLPKSWTSCERPQKWPTTPTRRSNQRSRPE